MPADPTPAKPITRYWIDPRDAPDQLAKLERGMEQSRRGEVVVRDFSAYADDVIEDEGEDAQPQPEGGV